MSGSDRGLWRILALVGCAACGGTSFGVPGGAGRDAAPEASKDGAAHAEGGTGDAGGPGDAQAGTDAAGETGPTTPKPYDGTTGKACATDADCRSPGGPGIARCSSSVFAPDDFYPTPVCILPTCADVSGATGIHYCDGPDDPGSPGMCVPWGTTGGNVCVPKCAYDTAGGPATGCRGKDTCVAYTVAPEDGTGYCLGGCTADSDCRTGQHCQSDRGFCLVNTVPPTKSIGAACTATDYDDYACRCFYGGEAKTGYCSSFCVVGGPSTCPARYACDALEYRSSGYTKQNAGMAGWCVATCTASGEGSACPPASSCSNANAAGPDCLP